MGPNLVLGKRADFYEKYIQVWSYKKCYFNESNSEDGGNNEEKEENHQVSIVEELTTVGLINYLKAGTEN